MHRNYLVALGGAILALGAVPSAVASSSAPAAVTVRVEGRTHTLLAPKVAQTQTGWITQSGAPTGACPADGAAGALDVATNHSWSGKFFAGQGIFITKILGDNESGKKFFWAIFVNNVSAKAGACSITLHPGDKLLFAAVSAKRAAYPTALRGPQAVSVGSTFRVHVVYFNALGRAKPLKGARITGNGVNSVTNAHGFITIKATRQGTLHLRTSPAGFVRAVPLAVQELPVY
jgi:Domain of unknown function (DUF4430)